ncbi:MAG TPA: ectonucleotide pyrophosphatase/phosphodiesterase [Bacteroidota bacterium]|nr:ectonucleotide pyrophosphatase/phosphodiesterase [Bacteroidota bacterium]
MRRLRTSIVLPVAVIFLFSAAFAPTPVTNLPLTVLLISIDGFRYDYFEKTHLPNFDRLLQNGLRAQWLIPQFPTKTFPNHYTIVTGLRPESHGIVANTMYDPEFGELFSMSNRRAVRDTKWWGGEPIWVTAEKQGQKTAPYFWPGSEARIHDAYATYWRTFDQTVPDSQRVRDVFALLDRPVSERPTFITLYFETIDNAGHNFGPDSSALLPSLRAIDAVIGYLLEGLETRGILDKLNLIIVSDHGMSQLSVKRVINIDDFVDTASVRIVDLSPVASLWPKPGKEDAVYRSLVNAHPHLKVYRKSEIPERWHFRNHRRVAPIIAVADDGWSIVRSTSRRIRGGNHGYDNALESMRAILLLHGPAFKKGIAEPVENIHLYNLICAILNLKPAPNEGSDVAIKALLK